MSLCNVHKNCLTRFYPKSNKIKRGLVPLEKVKWEEPFPDYSPVSFTSPNVLSLPSYADPDINDPNFKPKWNTIDGKINRKSHTMTYEIISGVPRNYIGRTGIIGRGCLGRWGPNHAADPIVTRWKLDKDGNFMFNGESNKRVLQFACIERHDCREWAIPGGMVDPGETVSETLQREFMEEALDSLQMTPREKEEAQHEIQEVFNQGREIFRGYVDDPRNTDNAWMETIAVNFHGESPHSILHRLTLSAGDDARSVTWMDVSAQLRLYASHQTIVAAVAQKLGAHW